MRKEKVTPHRQPRPGEADEQGDGGAGAKGGDRAQQGREGVGPQPPEAPQDALAALGGKVALDVGDEEDQEAEQQGDLRHVVEKKLHAAPQPGGQVQAQGGQACADGVVEPGHAQDLGLEEIPWGHWGTILSKSGR